MPSDDNSRGAAILDIIERKRRMVLDHWQSVRHGTLNEAWLNAATLMLDVAADDVFSVLARRRHRDVSRADVSTVAHFVCMAFRCNSATIGERVYNLYHGAFHRHRTDECILASAWVNKPIPDAMADVERVLDKCIALGRDTSTGLAVYTTYATMFPASHSMHAHYRTIKESM